MTDWIITLPQTVDWEDYEKELKIVQDGSSVLNFRVPHIPKDMRPKQRCFICWRGKVRGWMEIAGYMYMVEPWNCSTTGKEWPAGSYVRRSGPFFMLDEEPEMKGFRGIRSTMDPKSDSIYKPRLDCWGHTGTVIQPVEYIPVSQKVFDLVIASILPKHHMYKVIEESDEPALAVGSGIFADDPFHYIYVPKEERNES